LRENGGFLFEERVKTEMFGRIRVSGSYGELWGVSGFGN